MIRARVEATPSILIVRLRRLVGRWAIPPWVLIGFAVFRTLVDVWSGVEFVWQKGQEYALLQRITSPVGLLFLAVLWFGFLLLRPPEPGAPQRLEQMRRLLHDAATALRARPEGVPTDFKEAGRFAWDQLRLDALFQDGFAPWVKREYLEFMDRERRIYGEGEQSFPAHRVAASFLDALANRLRASDVDPGFHMPDTFLQFRDADRWPPNTRPVEWLK